MKQKHPHYEAIIAWANGEPIEMTCKGSDCWISIDSPSFSLENQYRVRKEPKPDVVKYGMYDSYNENMLMLGSVKYADDILKLTFDGKTGKLKSAEVLV